MNQPIRQSKAYFRSRPLVVQVLSKSVFAILFAVLVSPAAAAGVTQPQQDITKLDTPVASAGSLNDDDANPAGPEKPPTIKDILLDVCTSHGYGEDCAKTLLGMAWKESQFVSTAVGDHGLAQGWFQIHTTLHHVKVKCAQDLRCSADWTIKYLESNSYPKYIRYAVQCHNSCNVANGYAASALRNGERLWNELPPVQAAAVADSQILALRQ